MNTNLNIEQYLTDRVEQLRVRTDVRDGKFAKIDKHQDDPTYASDVAGWRKQAMIDTNKITGAYSELYALARACGVEIIFNRKDKSFEIKEVALGDNCLNNPVIH